MARRTQGSVYRERSGTVGIRWPENGHRPQQGGFHSEDEARAWFAANVLERVQPRVQIACDQIRAWARRRRADDAGSWIYVIAAPEVDRIKVGRTTVPGKRLKDLRTACPMLVNALLMIPGNKALEAKLHEVTRPFAIEGAGSEWRTIEALEIVFAFLRERAIYSPPRATYGRSGGSSGVGPRGLWSGKC